MPVAAFSRKVIYGLQSAEVPNLVPSRNTCAFISVDGVPTPFQFATARDLTAFREFCNSYARATRDDSPPYSCSERFGYLDNSDPCIRHTKLDRIRLQTMAGGLIAGQSESGYFSLPDPRDLDCCFDLGACEDLNLRTGIMFSFDHDQLEFMARLANSESSSLIPATVELTFPDWIKISPSATSLCNSSS